MFMPHSPGVYIALVLKQVEEIEQEQLILSKGESTGDESLTQSQSASVKRIVIKNNLFLDIDSLSKNL